MRDRPPPSTMACGSRMLITTDERAGEAVAIELHLLGRLRVAGLRRVGDLGGAQRAAGAPRELSLQAAGRSARSRCSRCGRNSSAGPGRSSSRGWGRGLWPHSPAIACAPVSGRPSITTPPPTPVPRITPNTMPQPAAAPSDASETAKQLASFCQPHLAAERALEVLVQRLAVQPGRVGVLDQAGGGRDRAGMADADRATRADLRLEFAPRARRSPRRVSS